MLFVCVPGLLHMYMKYYCVHHLNKIDWLIVKLYRKVIQRWRYSKRQFTWHHHFNYRKYENKSKTRYWPGEIAFISSWWLHGCLPGSLCLPECPRVSLCIGVTLWLRACVPTCLPAWVPPCVLACLPTCQIACQPVPACVRGCLIFFKGYINKG